MPWPLPLPLQVGQKHLCCPLWLPWGHGDPGFLRTSLASALVGAPQSRCHLRALNPVLLVMLPR